MSKKSTIVAVNRTKNSSSIIINLLPVVPLMLAHKHPVETRLVFQSHTIVGKLQTLRAKAVKELELPHLGSKWWQYHHRRK
jgi:hypothetical protein